MQEIPDCLNRRYRVLDELVKELSSTSDADFNDDVSGTSHNDPGVRLMCEFWNILKENPDCNLTKTLQSRMELSPKNSMFQPKKLSCYMACSNKGDDARRPDSGGKVPNQCCHRGPEQVKSKCCGSKSLSSSQASSDALPLSKVLCNLNEAASFDRKCQGMVNDLMAAQKQLQDQIQHLEHREAEGVELLKKADCMWSCMEDAYKKKILESQERQQELIKQLKEAEANTNKWRKNKKDLDLQMENVNTCHQEISEKLQQKQNDLKCMNRDIADYKKRIENNKKEVEAAKKSVSTKKYASDERIKKISADIYKREAMIREEKARKEEKEKEGNQYIKEARADLLNLSKILLQKKIENEDLKTEKETILDELDILSQSYDQCKDRCQLKKQSMEDEIKKVDNEIKHYQAKCLRCHQCTDTLDIRKFCTDCPRCLEERECLYKEGHCSPDHTMDCVCMSVKQKFLDNVFENMYTVLERQIKTGPGKCVAETILNCLKKSRNGKLDQQTRKILQDFILTTVKKNLNLTIVGGAVKTRCELDPETYKQLMLCLKQVKAVRPPKADKQTAAKKPPCARWSGETECNCPKGPNACICTKRAPPPPNEPGPCPPQDEEDKGEEKICPHKESTSCGPDCAMHAVPSAVGTDVAAWRPDPCQGPTCMFKNMRAAQCVLGPEALNTKFDNRSFVTAVPYVPNITSADDQISCKCGSSTTKPCTCKDTKQMKVEKRMQCDDEICGMFRSKFLGEKSSNSITKPQNNLVVDDGDSKRIHQETKNNQCDPMENIMVDNKLKGDLIKEQFQPLLITKSIQNESGLFETNKLLQNDLPITSEVTKLDIDENIVDIIENITKQDPSSFVSLKKTKSGHLTLSLNSVKDDDGQSIVIKRSASGDMIIEIEKKAIRNLGSDKLNKEIYCNKTTKTENIGVHVPKISQNKEKCSKSKENSHDGVKNFLLHNFKRNFSACKSKRKTICKDFLQKMYENKLRNINVWLKHQCKKLIYAPAVLREISCENIAIHIENGNIIDARKIELPVLLQRTESDTIYIDTDADVTTSNGVATRTTSNGFLIYSKQSNLQEMKLPQHNVPEAHDVFKIKIKGLDNEITEPPAVIRRTSSGNFDVVIEKEYEKYCQQTIRDQTTDGNESFFDLTKTSSSVILDFEKNNVRSNSQKALLMKSNSGLLKIIVSDAKANEQKEKRKNSVTFGSMMSAKALEDLLTNLPSSSKSQRKNVCKTVTKTTKSSSDSNLYGTAKMNLHSSQSLLKESSTTLKKTPSGQYAVVLDKDLKKSFINNLLSYLDKSSNGVIPIKRTDSGDITVSFDKNTRIGESGSLKITSSGNIYIILDEGHIKRISNNIAINTCNSNKSDVSSYIWKTDNPENKAIATNCNAYPDDSICDGTKCICERLNIKRDSLENCTDSPNESHKLCGKTKCSGQRDKQCIKSNNKSPHIVIRSCESRPEPDKRNKFQESYYCEVQSVCPYHSDRYNGISNELLEISGSCNPAQEKMVSPKGRLRKIKQFMVEKKVNYDWNSFDYLPHQLPSFLKNITYS